MTNKIGFKSITLASQISEPDVQDVQKVLLRSGFELNPMSRLFNFGHDCCLFHPDRDSGNIFIGFSPTNELEDWLSNIKRFFMRETKDGQVHRGFHQSYSQFRSALHNMLFETAGNKNYGYKRIVFFGHSRGGALATIGSAAFAGIYNEQQIHLITWGSPRVGDKVLKKNLELNRVFIKRFVISGDPVPWLPFFGYKHVSPAIKLGKKSWLPNISNHNLNLYRQRFILECL